MKPIRDEGMRQLAKLGQLPKVDKPSAFYDLRGGGKDTSYVDEAGFALHEDDSFEGAQDRAFKKGYYYV